MKIVAWLFVKIAWWLPGRPHRWACRLQQERAAMLTAEKLAKRRYEDAD
jgi:hypothetical protein